MTFSRQFNPKEIEERVDRCNAISTQTVKETLHKTSWNGSDLLTLLSPAAEPYLEQMAILSQKLTEQRFGKIMSLFIPLYLSNECYNKCTYCGFSVEHKYPRKTLTDKEMLKEGWLLKEKGFKQLLLLTGEAQGKVDMPYFRHALSLLKPLFPSIGIEVQPLSEENYRELISIGVDHLAIYQETYHPEAYKTYHLTGKKKNFSFRLDTPDHGGKAGFYRMSLGALLGLHDWRYECLALQNHLDYVQKYYWQTKFGLSFPRIKEMYGTFSSQHDVSDRALIQAIIAFRLCYPDLTLSLSTREPAALRDVLMNIGITHMSAESNTAPGGYSGDDSEAQFSISDHRSITEIIEKLKENNLEPVFKDWETANVIL